MFDRKLITVALLSFTTMLAIRLIFKDSSVQSQQTVQLGQQAPGALPHGAAYKLPTKQDLMKPAVRDVSFADEQREGELLTTVELDNYQAGIYLSWWDT